MTSADAQCIQLSPEKLLIAVADGRSWLTSITSSEISALPVTAVAAERASLAASAIEGAVVAGLAPAGGAKAIGSCTLLRYVRWLAGNYVFAAQTPGLFRRGAERFAAAGRLDLAQFSAQKAQEETGHADLAYRDIEALGLPAAEAIRIIHPPSADFFANRFRDYVESTNPIALFGFSYAMERMALARDDAFISEVQALCPPGTRAFRFLKVHSKVGNDRSHVFEQLSVFETFTAPELASVACAALETAEMLRRQPIIDQELTDEEISSRLRRAGIRIGKKQPEESRVADVVIATIG